MAKVYFWLPNTTGNVGHLSMSLDEGEYFSCWPKEDLELPFSVLSGMFSDSLEQDINVKGRPNLILNLPKEMLNMDAIKTRMRQYKATPAFNQLALANCALMVKKMLKKGMPRYRRFRGFARPIKAPLSVYLWIAMCKAQYEAVHWFINH